MPADASGSGFSADGTRRDAFHMMPVFNAVAVKLLAHKALQNNVATGDSACLKCHAKVVSMFAIYSS
jgi:hypothetical protein